MEERLNLLRKMCDTYFVEPDSIVRHIWGTGDTVLFIFAGAAAEFALNKAVDWLYFTGRLPNAPLDRLFSTVSYARQIVFSTKPNANRAIDTIASIHQQIESRRGSSIPEWAYRDVLFMLIDYSVRSYELLERDLSSAEKEEVFHVFYRVGVRMGLSDLPTTYPDWQIMRREHLDQNLEYGGFTTDLFGRYRIHLGLLRYRIMLESQNQIVPEKVRDMLGFKHKPRIKPLIGLYKFTRMLGVDRELKALILPKKYRQQIFDLDQPPER